MLYVPPGGITYTYAVLKVGTPGSVVPKKVFSFSAEYE